MATTKQKKKIIELYAALLNFYFKNGRKEMDVDDKPFQVFLEVLYPVLSKHDYFSNDIFEYSIINNLERMKKLPVHIGEQEIDNLIKLISNDFEKYKKKHYLVFPLQGSELTKDISFSKFHLLTFKSKDAIIKQISSITSIGKHKVKEYLEHTERSRSKDFLQSNIMVIEVENQTENVKWHSYKLGQSAVDFFILINSAFAVKQKLKIQKIIHLLQTENKHIAILSEDGWRCGHGSSFNAHLQCKLNLDFMAEPKYQQIFEQLFSSFALKKRADELTYKFINAFLLYSRANIQQDEDIALLLYITALESLITEKRQEKRLRLAAVVPKIINVDGYTSHKLSEILDKLYMKRNDFVHAGQSPYFHYEEKELALLERITAVVILKYFEADSLIRLKQDESRIHGWDAYIDNIFKTIIFG